MTDAAVRSHKLRAFLAAMTRATDGWALPEAIATSSALLAELVAQDDWLPDDFAQPHPEFYQQYLLYCDPLERFSVVSFVWGPGQQTPIHDHCTWGLVGMLRGAEISRAFSWDRDRLVPGDEVRLEPGTVMTLLPDDGDIHQVRNAFDDAVSISIHVYGGDIGAIERHAYPSDGGVKTFVSGYSNTALPNVWGRA